MVTKHFEIADKEEYEACLKSGEWSMVPKDVIPHFGEKSPIPIEKTINKSVVRTTPEVPPGEDPNAYPYKKYPSQMNKEELIAAAEEVGLDLTGEETRHQLRTLLKQAKKDDSQGISEIDSE